MSKSVSVWLEVEQGVAILTFLGPQGNALTSELRKGLFEKLNDALNNERVDAVVLLGAGTAFSSGLASYETDIIAHDREVSAICALIESAAKPVVAAIRGVALGSGFELALACHFRIVEGTARVGLPDIGLGLTPGCGGTQLLPRLVGAANSLLLLWGAKPIPVTHKAVSEVFDQVVQDDVRTSAVAFVRSVLEAGKALVKPSDNQSGFVDMAQFQADILRGETDLSKRPNPIALEILRCVEASALLPFELGLTFERECRQRLVQSDVSHSLRYIQLAEQRAASALRSGQGKAREIRQIGVIGAGRSGASIVFACLISGYEVVLVERDKPSMEKGLRRIQVMLDRAAEVGRLSVLKRDAIEAMLKVKPDLVALAESDLIIEAVGSELAHKVSVFSQLDGVAKDGAILLSQSAMVDVAELAKQTGCPEDVLGVCFHAATQPFGVVEIAMSGKTSADAISSVLQVLRHLNRFPVRSGRRSCGIGLRVMSACLKAADDLVLRGADPYQVDRAMRRWGFSSGPFLKADIAGFNSDLVKLGEGFVGRELIANGRSGRRSGRGWYQTSDRGQRDQGDIEGLTPLIEIARKKGGLPLSTFSEADIQLRCLAGMANAGARLIRTRAVVRASDIDLLMVHGFGVARSTGGPMISAGQYGLLNLRKVLRDLDQGEGGFWKPDPLIDELIKNGKTFEAV